jgi:hypothetical protein
MEETFNELIQLTQVQRLKILDWARNHKSDLGKAIYNELMRTDININQCKGYIKSIEMSNNFDDDSFFMDFINTDKCEVCAKQFLSINTVYLGEHTTYSDSPDCINCGKLFCIHCMSNTNGVCKLCYIEGDSD